MEFKKIAALILAAAMAIPLLASCANNAGENKNTRPVVDGGSSDIGNFASGDFDNEDFTFLFIQQKAGNKDYYGGDYLDAESLTGATIQDAVYKRNLAVEELYKVNVTQRLEENGDPAALLQTFYMSGDFCFDVIYAWGYKLGLCIVENYFADMSKLPNTDLSKEYWCPSAMEDLMVNNSLYICINDISMNKLEWAGFLFYNKQIAEDYNVETTLGSPYDLVREGKWTLDKYLQMISSVSNDLDGDGKITKTDVYGVIGQYSHDLALSAGTKILSKNDDGSYSLSYYNEKTIDIANKVNNVLSNTKYSKDYTEIWENADTSGFNDQWEYVRSFFATDHSLFLIGSAFLTGELRNMESEYGIIPFPKYDENQENYIHYVADLASIFAIPSTYRTDVQTASPDRTGMILEYMAYKSNELVLPKYYDTLLKGQRLNSEDDQLMLDVIRDTIHYDLCSMVGLNGITSNFQNVVQKPNTASSTYKRNEAKLNKQLNDFYMDMLNLTLEEEANN